MLFLYSALFFTIANAFGIDWAGLGPYGNYWGEYWAVKQYGLPPNIDPTNSGEPVYTSNYRREIYLGGWGWNGTERTSCDGLVTAIYVVTKGGVPMCLDSGLEPTAGRGLKVWECLGNVPQQTWVWTVYGTGDAANSTFSLRDKDLCVSFGNPLKLQPCNITDAGQLWKVYGKQPWEYDS